MDGLGPRYAGSCGDPYGEAMSDGQATSELRAKIWSAVLGRAHPLLVNRTVTYVDLKRFTRGDCHYLARALHEATGWPMGAYADKRGYDGHAFVLVGDSHVLDVMGLQSIPDARAIWGKYGEHCEIRTVEWANFAADGWCDYGPEFGRYSLTRARVLAPRLAALADGLEGIDLEEPTKGQ